MQRIAINGFGRIGRHVVRAWFESEQQFDFDIVAMNDIADIFTLAHLFKYDSTHGRFAGQVNIVQQEQSNILQIISKQRCLNIHVFQCIDPSQLTWANLNVDVVLECTGLFRSRQASSLHLQAGAKRVIIGAAPFDSVDISVVYGINHQDIQPHHQLISSVSCTTQALVPLVKILDETFHIDSALMTEIHAVTADQSVLDQAHRDLRRARASGHNIIPTTSSAIGALKQVLPHMADKIDGYSIRVPTINVAGIDLTFMVKRTLSVQHINQCLIQASQTHYQRIMATVDEPLVSSDFNHSPYSLIADLTQTICVGQQAKVFAWYDNEWGYANRLLDLCQSLNK